MIYMEHTQNFVYWERTSMFSHLQGPLFIKAISIPALLKGGNQRVDFPVRRNGGSIYHV